VISLIGLENGTVVCGSSDASIKVWRVPNVRCQTTLTGHLAGVSALAVCAGSRLLISGDLDGVLKVWNVHMGTLMCTLNDPEPMGPIWALAAVSHDQFVSSAGFGSLRLWSIASQDWSKEAQLPQTSTNALCALSTGQLVSGSSDAIIRLWNADNLELRGTLEGHTAPIEAICEVFPERIATISTDKTIRFWDVPRRQCYATVSRLQNLGAALCATPDGAVAAAGNATSPIIAWDGSTGAVKQMYADAGSAVTVVALCVVLAPSEIIDPTGDSSPRSVGPLPIFCGRRQRGPLLTPSHSSTGGLGV
jgi:WD40 repeat protein